MILEALISSLFRRLLPRRGLFLFYRNLLLNENHPLYNWALHISGTFKEIDKPDIEKTKPDIEKPFQPKTEMHILKLHEVFPSEAIFGRSDVMKN